MCCSASTCERPGSSRSIARWMLAPRASSRRYRCITDRDHEVSRGCSATACLPVRAARIGVALPGRPGARDRLGSRRVRPSGSRCAACDAGAQRARARAAASSSPVWRSRSHAQEDHTTLLSSHTSAPLRSPLGPCETCRCCASSTRRRSCTRLAGFSRHASNPTSSAAASACFRPLIATK